MRRYPFAAALLLFLAASLLPSFALAQRGHIVLLSVEQTDNPFAPDQGGTADLYLEIRPGTGQVFLDTFPLTKLDTQSSTRYANQVACSYAGVDCSRYDFLYTIRADSTVIGGPSAGGAITVLTAAMLLHEPLDDTIAMTGTINSGGIIGPVAGIKAKTLAAKARGLKKVLISSFAYPTELNRTYALELNTSGGLNRSDLNLSRLYVPVNLTGLGIDVREVSTLDEAIRIFTDRPAASTAIVPPSPPPEYTAIMRQVAQDLCSRRDNLAATLPSEDVANLSDGNRTSAFANATASGDWYSVASYCFGDVVRLRAKAFESLSQVERRYQYLQLTNHIKDFEQNLEKRNLTTLADLETSVIVAERLQEAKDALQQENTSNISADGLAFAYERYNSANTWSAFFHMESPVITLDQQHLRQACTAKLAETDERLRYTELCFPSSFLNEAHQELDLAQQDSNAGRYPLCLFRASKAHALADLFVGTLSVPKEKIVSLVSLKLAAVAAVIVNEREKGFFPLIGYSYYRYASSLSAHNPYSAITFSEYALELSNLDMYFPQQRGFFLVVEPAEVILFASGLILGLAVGLFIAFRSRRPAVRMAPRRGRPKGKRK